MAMAQLTATFIAILCLLCATAAMGSATASTCKSPQSCQRDGSRTGGVFLQTVVDKDATAVDDVRDMSAANTNHARHASVGSVAAAASSKGMPLKGRLTGLETAVADLKARISALQTEVTGTSDVEVVASFASSLPKIPLAAASESLTEISDFPSWETDSEAGAVPAHHGHQSRAGHVVSVPEVSLVTSSVSEDAEQEQDPAMKDRVAALEADMADLKSKTSTLENEVMGNAFSLKMSLLEEGAGGSSLKGRIVSLEEESDALRMRCTVLEQKVIG